MAAAACSVLTHPHVASGLGDDTPLPSPKGGFCIGEQLDGELYGASSSGDLQRPGKGPLACHNTQHVDPFPHTIMFLCFFLFGIDVCRMCQLLCL